MGFKSINLPLLISSILLLSIGTLVIYSSSKEQALQQLVFGLIGIIFFIGISNFDYRALKSLIKPLYILILVLLVFVFLIGVESHGSVRWIPLGIFNIQPSEFAKPILVLLLADFWGKKLPSWRNIFLSLTLIAPVSLLIFKQPDLGTTLTIIVLWMVMVFAARISLKKILSLVLIIGLVLPLAWLTLHNYQRARIISFLSPGSDPLGVGYNIIQSTIAVGSGQFLGRGLGQGTQSRLQFLPEFRTDFIFASISEELGLVGACLLLLIYFFISFYSYFLSQSSRDSFGYLIILGVTSILLFQTVVNIGMNIGIFPITGITLPLVSYGGSSVISTMIAFGFISSVLRYRRRIDIEEE